MDIIFDFIMFFLCFFCTLHSLNTIIKNKTSSATHFIVILLFVICCLPIFFNYVIGYPSYETIYWYRVFKSSMHSSSIAIIYDIYIILTVLLLEMYAMYYDRVKSPYVVKSKILYNSLLQNKVIRLIAIFSPIIYIILSGNLSYFLLYGVRSSRYATDSDVGRIASMLILLSIYAYFFYFFSTSTKRGKVFFSLLYIFIITWLQGKRFIIVIIGIVILFYYTRNGLSRKKQKNLRRLLPVFAFLIILFSYFYLVIIRPMSNSSFSSIYDMLRVDFGRDDVIKYVIEKCIVKKETIVPYPGSSFLSTFLFFVPRTIWAAKPYPHYVYLTASILHLPIKDIPAGTTPSWLEMSIANFGVLGFVFGAISLLLLCIAIDRLKETNYQLIAVVLVCALLTQNIDVYLTFVVIFILQFLIRKITAKHRVVVVFAGKKIVSLGNKKENNFSRDEID